MSASCLERLFYLVAMEKKKKKHYKFHTLCHRLKLTLWPFSLKIWENAFLRRVES